MTPHYPVYTGGGLDVTTPFGEHEPHQITDKGGGICTAAALALFLVRISNKLTLKTLFSCKKAG